MGLDDFFIDVDTLPDDGYGFFQLITLGAVYGYLLMYSSNLVSDGSELLLLVPWLEGIVGSIVLPVLGAVPDGALVLFSGTGPNAQEQLNIGVGALAGSTIMLLTIPWFLSVYAGRVPINDFGEPNYAKKKLGNTYQFPELLFKTGVSISSNINFGSFVLLVTSVTYLIIQLPGLKYLDDPVEVQAAGERPWALFGAIVCGILFFCYLLYQYRLSQLPPSMGTTQTLITEDYMRNAIVKGEITLLQLMVGEFERSKKQKSNTSYESLSLNEPDPEMMLRLDRLLRPFFKVYDKDDNGSLEIEELYVVFADLGVRCSFKEFTGVFSDFDVDKNGVVDYQEFVHGTAKYIWNNIESLEKPQELKSTVRKINSMEVGDHHDDDEEEEEEVPEDIRHLTPEEQQKYILKRAFQMMLLGSLIIMLISDPMVGVLNEVGKRTGIPGFYISFIMAPIISNASEIIATYNYGKKKSPGSISVSLATLQGAVVMNNTFVLGIFMLLIYLQGLSWEFLAETLTILLIQATVALLGMKSQHTVFDAAIILSLYPLSLVLVSVLESMGWD